MADAKTRGGRVLDIGCGDGLLLLRHAPFAQKVVGIYQICHTTQVQQSNIYMKTGEECTDTRYIMDASQWFASENKLSDNLVLSCAIEPTLEQLCQCAVKWSQLSNSPENISEKNLERIAFQLMIDLSEIDKSAFEDENRLWPVAIEEFSYGI